MGDGNLYPKKEAAIEIECQDCHGTPDEYPWDENWKVTTSGAYKMDGSAYCTAGGNELTNMDKRENGLFLISKGDGTEHAVPVVKDIIDGATYDNPMMRTAMSSIPHLEELECYACHARWAPQCYGCHAKMDMSVTSGDWISGEQDAYGWSESRSYLRWEDPVLGRNPEGYVSPFIPGCQVIFTQLDENGDAILDNYIYTTTDGTSGIAQNPIQPHTVSKEARTCEECHADPKALGLGSGIYDIQDNGVDIDFELERIVDEDGNQIQATSHYVARPFNKTEMDKISRVGVCFGCHQSYDDPLWDKVVKETGMPETPGDHVDIMDQALRSIPPQQPDLYMSAVNGFDGDVGFVLVLAHVDVAPMTHSAHGCPT